jgi:hypothetical protein
VGQYAAGSGDQSALPDEKRGCQGPISSAWCAGTTGETNQPCLLKKKGMPGTNQLCLVRRYDRRDRADRRARHHTARDVDRGRASGDVRDRRVDRGRLYDSRCGRLRSDDMPETCVRIGGLRVQGCVRRAPSESGGLALRSSLANPGCKESVVPMVR